MIVDGGLGIELARRGFEYTTSLWSAEAILREPQLLTAIHRAYLAAGAQVIETATYQLSHVALRKSGHSDAHIDEIFALAVQLARAAITAHRAQTGELQTLFVAASLGPYGATIGDGSEYSGKQHLGRDELYAFHAERVTSMARAEPDILLFETLPSLTEASVVAEVARDLHLQRAWISLSCADGTQTYGGDSVRDIGALLDAFPAIDVVGINCTAPAAIASLVRELRAATTKPLMVCPNLGQHWENDTHSLAGGTPAADLLRRVPQWLELGVTNIGGCCGVGPPMIGEIAKLVRGTGAAVL